MSIPLILWNNVLRFGIGFKIETSTPDTIAEFCALDTKALVRLNTNRVYFPNRGQNAYINLTMRADIG